MRKTTKACAVGTLALVLGGMTQLSALANEAPGGQPAPSNTTATNTENKPAAEKPSTDKPSTDKPVKEEENDYGHTPGTLDKMKDTRAQLEKYQQALTDKVPAGYEKWAQSKEVQEARAKAKKEYDQAFGGQKLTRDEMKQVVAYNEGKINYLPKHLWKYSEKAQKEKPAVAPAAPEKGKVAQKKVAEKKAEPKKVEAKKGAAKKGEVKKVVKVVAGTSQKKALANTGSTAAMVGGVSLALLLAGGGACAYARKRA